MRFTEHELTAALTGAAKTVLASQRKDVRRGRVDIDTVWDEMDRYQRFQLLDGLGSEIALTAWLRSIGKTVCILNDSLVPSAFAFLTREVPIDIAVQIGVDTLEAASTFSLKQTDFGIKPFSGGPGGTVKVADRVTFSIRAIALRSAPEHLVSK